MRHHQQQRSEQPRHHAIHAITAAIAAVLLLLVPVSARQTPRDAPAKPDVLYIPTPQPVVDAMLRLAEVKATDVVYDLGSGDGRIVITAAKTYGARGVGIELDPALVKQARENAVRAGVAGKVRFVTQDLFKTDLRPATVVTLYLLQSLNERLRPKLVRELRAGARVVSHVFNMGPEWPPLKSETVERNRIFLWSVPGR